MQPSDCSHDSPDPAPQIVVSSHVTSEGVVFYLRCECGAWLVRTATPFEGVVDTAAVR